MIDEDKLDPINKCLLMMINCLKDLKVENHILISATDYLDQDPSMGFSVGFSTPEGHDHNTFTLFLFCGQSYPNNSDTVLQYHMDALTHIKMHNPAREDQVKGSYAHWVKASETNMGYLMTHLGPCEEDPRDMVVVTTMVFGAIFKIRATMDRFDKKALDIFFEESNALFRAIELELIKLNQ